MIITEIETSQVIKVPFHHRMNQAGVDIEFSYSYGIAEIDIPELDLHRILVIE